MDLQKLQRLGLVLGMAALVGTGNVTLTLAEEMAEEVLLQTEGTLEEGDQTASELPGHFFDDYVFNVRSGQFITILLKSEDFTPSFIIFDSNGTVVERNNAIQPGILNFIQIPEAASYTLLITSAIYGDIGSYQLEITDTSVEKATADQLFQQGREGFHQGRIRDALTFWKQALAIYQSIGDRRGEARAISF